MRIFLITIFLIFIFWIIYKLLINNHNLIKKNREFVSKVSLLYNIINYLKNLLLLNSNNYVQSLKSIARYVNDKHNDDFILKQICEIEKQFNIKINDDKNLKQNDDITSIKLTLDDILDRINKIGYDNLTVEEKNFLINLKT